RARSSRTSRAMTWNFVRLAGPTLHSIDLASTSRTRRARIGMIGAGSSPERWRLPPWRVVAPFAEPLASARPPIVASPSGSVPCGDIPFGDVPSEDVPWSGVPLSGAGADGGADTRRDDR